MSRKKCRHAAESLNKIRKKRIELILMRYEGEGRGVYKAILPVPW